MASVTGPRRRAKAKHMGTISQGAKVATEETGEASTLGAAAFFFEELYYQFSYNGINGGEPEPVAGGSHIPTEPQPAVRALVAKITYEGCGVLLDSGATHILRAPRSQAEWNGAEETIVQTATGECVLRQTGSGVLLTSDQDVAPIIPLGELVAQGGVIEWRPGRCKLHHPVAGVFDVKVVSNCPYVSTKDGERLMACLEDEKKKVQGVVKVLVHA